MTIFPAPQKAPHKSKSANKNKNVSVTWVSPKKFSRDLEHLDIGKALDRLSIPDLVGKAVVKTSANRYVKRYDRRDVAIGAIASILAGARVTEEITEFSLGMSHKIGISGFPERSNFSRIMSGIMDSVFFEVFKALSKRALRCCNLSPFDRFNVAVVDSHPVITKAKIASKGFLKGKVTKGVKIHMLTINGVPMTVLFSAGDEHDITRFEDLLKRNKNVEHLVADRAYIDFETIAELAKSGKSFTSRMKSNVKMTPLGVFKDGAYTVAVSYRDVRGIRVKRYEVYDEKGEKVFDVLSTLDDWKLAVQLYSFRWHIEVIFRHLSNMEFKPLGYSYKAFSASVFLYLIAYLITLLYGILSRRGNSITKVRRKFKRWFISVYEPPRKPPD